jgi:hypothetical protein
MKEITDQMWWKMCSANMSHPVPLHEADHTVPFVYDRDYGFFYVPFGYHQIAMATLLGFHCDRDDLIDLAKEHGVEFSSGLADEWLEGEGRCFRSSAGNDIVAGYKANLNAIERRIFGNVRYIFEEGL